MIRSLLRSADLAVWLWTILFKGKACRSYNVGSDQEITISQLTETAASTLGGSVQLLAPSTLNFNSQLHPPSRYVPDVRRIKSELGLTEWTGRKEAVSKTAIWWRSMK